VGSGTKGSGGRAGLGRLAGGQPLDDAELGALSPFDLESLGLHLQQRAAQQVLLAQRNGDPL
jgi:hypothetical protein